MTVHRLDPKRFDVPARHDGEFDRIAEALAEMKKSLRALRRSAKVKRSHRKEVAA